VPEDASRPRILYSVGYQGRELAQLVDALHGSGISTVVDVRLNPISRTPGFSKGPLSAALAGAGIGYVHERSLGNPPENRAAFGGGGGGAARRVVLDRLCTDGAAAMERLVDAAASTPVAVLCLERSRDQCHRAVILERACTLDPGLEVRDID
jgi:uncharacterized protein (DUF488 family)